MESIQRLRSPVDNRSGEKRDIKLYQLATLNSGLILTFLLMQIFYFRHSFPTEQINYKINIK